MEQVAARGHAPLISTCTDPALTRVPVPWLIRIVPDTRAELRGLLGALPGRPPASIPAIVPAGREGRSIRGDLEAVGRICGVSFDPVIEQGRAVREGWLSEIKERGAGPIVVWLGRDAIEEALDGVASLGWKGPVLLPREALKGKAGAGKILERLHLLVVRLFDISEKSPHVEEFVRTYRETYGVDPDEAAALSFDAASLLIAAIRGAGADRSAVRDWLAAMGERKGVTGRLLLDGTGNRGLDPRGSSRGRGVLSLGKR